MKTSRKSRCKRNQSGGGLGGVVEFAPGSPLVNNDLAWKMGSSCLAEERFGFLPSGYTGPKGLPGMSGGARKVSKKSKKSKKSKSRKILKRVYSQRGGRYAMGEFDGAGMGTPWGSGLAPTTSIPCEASRSTIPESGASGSLNLRGGPLWDGPVAPKGMMGGGPPTSASPSEIVPTARYSDLADPAGISTSAGTKLMIHTPINASEMNPACLKTGGGRRKSKRSSYKSKSKKTKKSRKMSKRNRKH